MASKTSSLLSELAQKVGSFRHTESEQQISSRDYESRVVEMLKAWDDFYQELGVIGDKVENNNGVADVTPFSPIFGSNPEDGDFLFLSNIGTAGEVLTSNGPGLLPSYQAVASGGGIWGAITGDITDQADLVTYIDNLDALYVSLTGTYDDPTWLNSLEWSKITSSPTFRIDGGTASSIYNSLTKIDGGTA